MDGSIYYEFKDEAHADAMIATLEEGDYTHIQHVGVQLDENDVATTGYLVHIYTADDDLPIEGWEGWVVDIEEPPHVIAGREELQAEGSVWGKPVEITVADASVPARVPVTDEIRALRAARRAANAEVQAAVVVLHAKRAERDNLRDLVQSLPDVREALNTRLPMLRAARDAQVAIAQDVGNDQEARQAARDKRDEINAQIDATIERRDWIVNNLQSLRDERDAANVEIDILKTDLAAKRAARDAAIAAL